MDELLLLPFISDEVAHARSLKVYNSAQCVFGDIPTEGCVGGKIAIAVFGIESKKNFCVFFRRACAGNTREQKIFRFSIYIPGRLVII